MRVVKSCLLVAIMVAAATVSLAGVSQAQTSGGPGITSGNRMIALNGPSTSLPPAAPVLSFFGSSLGPLGGSYSAVIPGLWTWRLDVTTPRTYLRPSAHAVRERRSTR